jgi:hypothetical protein
MQREMNNSVKDENLEEVMDFLEHGSSIHLNGPVTVRQLTEEEKKKYGIA